MITELLQQLSLALDNKDWQRIANLDEQLRVTFKRKVRDCGNNVEKSERLIAEISSTSKEYSRLIEACKTENSELADQQYSLKKSRKANQQYLTCH
jgi:hypothetical protein